MKRNLKALLRNRNKLFQTAVFLAAVLLTAALWYVLWEAVPRSDVRYTLTALCGGFILLAALWCLHERRQVASMTDDLCRTLDALIAGRKPDLSQLYEDTLTSKIQGKLLQYYDIMNEGRLQSQRDKQTLQELVSDISHQVKTPIANIRMFTGILRQHRLSEEKRSEFLTTLDFQAVKLDFLIQSLIKMSRLETGTFVLHMEEVSLYDTIAMAISGVWSKAETKQIQLAVDCDSCVTVKHDPKWTAEALENILDNAVKYTSDGGSVTVNVRPWQFYTRIDITDTGIGIPHEHYNDVFKRFYRAEEVAAKEGVGLGLYLAQGIITRQKGYISVKSQVGKGTTFSIYLLS